MKSAINVTVETLVQLRQINAATGKIVSQTKPVKNLMFDGGLNALARSTNATYPAECSLACRVGDSTTADKVSSGAVTFTQSGTTVTASAGFFTAGMVGWILKYGTGTGGVEYYITAFTSTTQVTVDTSATVGATVGTVWNVARTTMGNLLFSSATYETTTGSCETTNSGAARTHKRTYNFAQQVSSYNVNEVGYFRALAGTTIFGRVVLSSTEVVAPTNFLQVVLSITFTYSPATPTAVANVGTNIDTAGNAMFEQFSSTTFSFVNSSGTANAANTACAADASNTCLIAGIVADYTQNATTGSTALSATRLIFANGLTWAFASSRGKMTLTANTTISTAGQTLYGVAIHNNNGNTNVAFDIKFTSTFALPTGSFLPQVVFACTYNRILNN